MISRISFGFCGRFTGAELLSFSLALLIVCVWVLTGHWLLMDGIESASVLVYNDNIHSLNYFDVSAMGMGLCVAFIAFVRLPSLKVSTLLLTGLLVYDVFWVFFSSYIFSANVMVKVSRQRSSKSHLTAVSQWILSIQGGDSTSRQSSGSHG